ncbi:RICIN domain-containing protein [Catenovulum sediminis]|uniref:RICIN domain-containing protein n=1 Tax=Catenovulum sediminis TaxID=1740262 RepID=A0ABV1RHP2_9ALTE
MKLQISKALIFCLVCFTTFWQCNAFADAEVTRNTDGSWLARVDGAAVYQGLRYFEAINAAANNMGAGTINIRNSGDSGPDGGNVYAIRPMAGQTLDFHGHQVNANGGDLVVPVYCDRRDNITVRNLHVVGNPRYGIWFRGCSNIILENISMDLSPHNAVGLGIRVDASTGPASNLTIQGSIDINGSTTHGVETYGIDGFTIGDVTVSNSGGCGLLLNDTRNGTVGNVVGHYNNWGGGYATFRVANGNGPNVSVDSVYSRNSGRGFFSVSGSYGTTVNYVDIDTTTSHGIFLEDASDTHVLAGTVANGNPNCQLVRTDNSSISVSGCSQVGTPPGGTINNGSINGLYRITPLHSGKSIDVTSCGSSSGSNIQQWSWLNNDCQKFNISTVDGIWHKISPVNAPDLALDVDSASPNNGANVMLWQYWAGTNQQFRFQSAGNGLWRIINRKSDLCLDVEALSNANGANVLQWECISGNNNQLFQLVAQ